jgi:hypothetical protein
MKKLLIALILLLAVGGVVFYFGWIQILIPAGAYAVVHTKTSGFETDVVPAGEFAWRAERLLPTNMTLYIFQIEPVQVRMPMIQAALPSAEVYSSAMPGNPDFSFKMLLNVTFFAKPEALPGLVSEEGLKPENMEAWYQKKGETLGNRLIQEIRNSPEKLLETDYFQDLTEKLSRDAEFSSLEIKSIDPLEITLPDLELYNEAKRHYFEMSSIRREKDILAIQEEKTNLNALREYGVLLNEYPILLKFLYLLNLKGEGLEILQMELPMLPEEIE